MTDELLGKYIAGEATADEQAAVRRWLAEHPDHQAEMRRFERIWQAAGSGVTQSGQTRRFDTDAAWQRMRGQMHRSTQGGLETGSSSFVKPPQPPPRTPEPQRSDSTRPLPVSPRTPWVRWARIAAVFLLISTVSVLTYRSIQTPDPIAQTTTILTQSTTTTARRLTLPDGSTVMLNRNSSIRYPDAFAGTTREVTLTGEAFFDVTPNARQPFIIHAQGTDVRVVGTSFGVRAYDRNVRVSVKTGRVIVRKKQQEVALVPGQQAAVDSSADTLRRLPRFDINALAFSTRRLEFTNQPLSSVVRTLSDYYQTDINLSASRLQGCRLTAQFENESVETVLDIVAETLHLNIQKTEKGFVLSGEGCGN